MSLCPSLSRLLCFLPSRFSSLLLPPGQGWSISPLFFCPSLLPPPSPPALLRCWSSRSRVSMAVSPQLQHCHPWDVPAQERCCPLPLGMDTPSEAAAKNPWKPQTLVVVTQAGDQDPGQGWPRLVARPWLRLGFTGMSPCMVTPHPSPLGSGQGGIERVQDLDLSFVSVPRVLKWLQRGFGAGKYPGMLPSAHPGVGQYPRAGQGSRGMSG